MGVGAVVWDAGDLLCDFMCHPANSQQYIHNKTVLDLGSGTGVCGIVAAANGAKQTWLTDVKSLKGLNMNNLNMAREAFFAAGDEPAAVRGLENTDFASYWWGTELPEELHLAENKFYDVIIASDDLYDDDAFPPLLASLKLLVGPTTTVLFSYKRRMDSREVPFFEKLSTILDLRVDTHFGDKKYNETYIVVGRRLHTGPILS